MPQDVPADVIMLPQWLIYDTMVVYCSIVLSGEMGLMHKHVGEQCSGFHTQWVSSHTSLLTSKYKHRYSQSVTRLEVQVNNTNPNTEEIFSANTEKICDLAAIYRPGSERDQLLDRMHPNASCLARLSFLFLCTRLILSFIK